MTVKNLSASVQGRLQNQARATKRPFQEFLQYFAMERFLYRLSKTAHRERFVLKGALMLYVWDAPLARATKDVDFLGRLDNSLENLERVVRDVCTADVEPDGVVFDPATVKTERIKEDADYEGVRVRFVGLLGKARVAMQIDVGFGDVVTPSAEFITYPTLLDFPAPERTSTSIGHRVVRGPRAHERVLPVVRRPRTVFGPPHWLDDEVLTSAVAGSAWGAVCEPLFVALGGTGSLRSHWPEDANACESGLLSDAGRDALSRSHCPDGGLAARRPRVDAWRQDAFTCSLCEGIVPPAARVN